MLYCPPNETLNVIWIDHGISKCFMNTVAPTVIGSLIFIMGTIQIIMYRKYATEVAPNHLSKSKLYHLQIFFTLFIPVLEITRFVLLATILGDKTIYGYMVTLLVNHMNFTFDYQIFLDCFVSYNRADVPVFDMYHK